MEGLKDKNFEHSVCFTAFDGEELGLLGSHEIANGIRDTPALKEKFLGAVISDMSTGFKANVAADRPSGYDKDNSDLVRGIDDPATDGIHIDGNEASGELVKRVGKAALRVVSDTDMPILESEASIWNSDQKSFHFAGLPAVDICAANHRVYRYWHHNQNTTDNLDPRIGTEISRSAVASAFDIAHRLPGRRVLEEMPSGSKTVPVFPNSHKFDVSLKQCGPILQEREGSLPVKAATMRDSSASKAHKAAVPARADNAVAKKGHFVHTGMSLELAKELEETLMQLEDSLKAAHI